MKNKNWTHRTLTSVNVSFDGGLGASSLFKDMNHFFFVLVLFDEIC